MLEQSYLPFFAHLCWFGYIGGSGGCFCLGCSAQHYHVSGGVFDYSEIFDDNDALCTMLIQPLRVNYVPIKMKVLQVVWHMTSPIRLRELISHLDQHSLWHASQEEIYCYAYYSWHYPVYSQTLLIFEWGVCNDILAVSDVVLIWVL